MGYFEVSLAFFSLFFLFYYTFFYNKNNLPTNWPILGMLPTLLKNLPRVHDYFHQVLQKSHLNFQYEGPWFARMKLLGTADPTNVHHIFSKNFRNYPKGSKFKEIFEVLGDGIFNTDSDLWQYHRKMAHSFLTHPRFHTFLVNKTQEKIETGLIPVLDHASKLGLEIDLQDLFERFTFDTICTIIMDHDPRTLCMDLPSLPSSKALNDIEEAILYRHAMPGFVWKLQRWLGVGQERKYKQGWETLDAFIYECISKKKKEEKNTKLRNNNDDQFCTGVDLISLYMDQVNNDDKFLRDTFLNFLIAGRDTTSVALSWFFYLLSKNPQVLSKIKSELEHTITPRINNKNTINIEDLNEKLVYLHGALCETLRLHPPVAFEAKVPIEEDVLPSGHKVDPSMQIIICLYAMGRMKSIWGEDCREFKPERWITERGKIKHEPSYKFLAFNAGPRTCVGKNMAFLQMKVVAAAILSSKYSIQPVEGHPVVLDVSIILHMKHGFKVKVLSTSQ